MPLSQGQLYSMTQRNQLAESKFLQAIRILRKLNHPDKSQPLSNLANLYRRQNKYVQADLLFKEALEVREKFKESLNCAQLYFSLGTNSKDMQKWEDSETYLKKA